MIAIRVNGRLVEIEEEETVAGLLRRLAVDTPWVAVELNREILPRARHPEVRLQPGDRVEIVHFVGGGS